MHLLYDYYKFEWYIHCFISMFQDYVSILRQCYDIDYGNVLQAGG